MGESRDGGGPDEPGRQNDCCDCVHTINQEQGEKTAVDVLNTFETATLSWHFQDDSFFKNFEPAALRPEGTDVADEPQQYWTPRVTPVAKYGTPSTPAFMRRAASPL